ncbi:MAG TPA: hypothetical protein PK228_09235 [Saprospiraceae bacterium]|nr:hypothetical protein [Saprospiraceae bacterium]
MPDAKIWNRDFPNLLMRDFLDETIFGYLIFQIGVLVAVAVGAIPFKKLHKVPPLTDLIKQNARYLVPPLIFGAIITLLYPILSFRPGIGYAIHILFNFTKFLPFAAGVLFFHSNRLRIIWIISLLVLFFLGILTGGRSTAMVSAFIYFIGFYFALSSVRAKRITLISAIVISIPVMSFLAFVGMFRHVVGRVDFSKIDWERAVSVYQKYEKIKDSKTLDLNSSEAQLQGWGRFVNFVNIVQFATIPSKREHLGFDGLFTVDLPYAFDIAFISGTTLEDRLRAKAANFRLNDYGFLVTLTSSVEYSIATDGYIRFGFLGIFVMAVVFAFFCQAIELIIYLISRKNSALYVFAILMVSWQAFLGYVYNIFAICRSMILALVAAYAIVMVVKIIQAITKSSRKRSKQLGISADTTNLANE